MLFPLPVVVPRSTHTNTNAHTHTQTHTHSITRLNSVAVCKAQDERPVGD